MSFTKSYAYVMLVISSVYAGIYLKDLQLVVFYILGFTAVLALLSNKDSK